MNIQYPSLRTTTHFVQMFDFSFGHLHSLPLIITDMRMKSRHLFSLGIIFNLAIVSIPPAALAQSHHWRGPDQNGNFGPGKFPSTLNAKTLKWKTPLPGKGTSTPILVNN